MPPQERTAPGHAEAYWVSTRDWTGLIESSDGVTVTRCMPILARFLRGKRLHAALAWAHGLGARVVRLPDLEARE